MFWRQILHDVLIIWIMYIWGWGVSDGQWNQGKSLEVWLEKLDGVIYSKKLIWERSWVLWRIKCTFLAVLILRCLLKHLWTQITQGVGYMILELGHVWILRYRCRSLSKQILFKATGLKTNHPESPGHLVVQQEKGYQQRRLRWSS